MTHEHGPLAHQFDDLDQQRFSLTLGMWVFLVTEVMIFGGLFAAYTVYRYLYTEEFELASSQLNWVLAGINTFVLISSSFTMALAVYSAEIGRHKRITAFLLMTILLGLVFLGIKFVEYAQDYHEGLIPLTNYFHAKELEHLSAVQSARVRLFLTLYFIMTGLHALHMIVGLTILAILAVFAWRGAFTPQYHPQIELTGLYWHFVDVIWIFLLPLLYLSGSN